MYIFLSLFAACCFAGSVIANKYLAKHLISNHQSLFTLTMFGFAPFLAIVPLASPIYLPAEALTPLTLYALFFTSGIYLFTKVIYQLDASTVGPLFQLQGVLVVILAAIFLNEHFSAINYIWMAAMVAGAMLVSVNERFNPQVFNKWGLLCILVMFLHAWSNIFIGKALQVTGLTQVLFFGYLINVGIATIYWIFKKPKILYPTKTLAIVLARSAFQFIGASALFYAYRQNVSISSVIGLMSAPIVFLVTVVASSFKPSLLEHHSYKVYIFRGIGLLIIIISAASLTLNK